MPSGGMLSIHWTISGSRSIVRPEELILTVIFVVQMNWDPLSRSGSRSEGANCSLQLPARFAFLTTTSWATPSIHAVCAGCEHMRCVSPSNAPDADIAATRRLSVTLRRKAVGVSSAGSQDWWPLDCMVTSSLMPFVYSSMDFGELGHANQPGWMS